MDVRHEEKIWGKKFKVEPSGNETAKVERDELEEYLAEPQEEDLDMKVLAWWQAWEGRWPNLAKMVKQYFAAPASSHVGGRGARLLGRGQDAR